MPGTVPKPILYAMTNMLRIASFSLAFLLTRLRPTVGDSPAKPVDHGGLSVVVPIAL